MRGASIRREWHHGIGRVDRPVGAGGIATANPARRQLIAV
jgi:hypothetical protein